MKTPLRIIVIALAAALAGSCTSRQPVPAVENTAVSFYQRLHLKWKEIDASYAADLKASVKVKLDELDREWATVREDELSDLVSDLVVLAPQDIWGDKEIEEHVLGVLVGKKDRTHTVMLLKARMIPEVQGKRIEYCMASNGVIPTSILWQVYTDSYNHGQTNNCDLVARTLRRAFPKVARPNQTDRDFVNDCKWWQMKNFWNCVLNDYSDEGPLYSLATDNK